MPATIEVTKRREPRYGEDHCHVLDPRKPFEKRGEWLKCTALCGHEVEEESCCVEGRPDCGRPKCPDCRAIDKEFSV